MGKLVVGIKAFLLCCLVITGLTACGGSGSSNSQTASTQNDGSWADISVASGNQSITLSWTKKDAGTADSASTPSTSSTPAPTYNVYWSNTSGVTKKNGNKIADVTSPYVHTGLVNGTRYYYVVTEVLPSGVESAESYESSATPQANIPAAPTGLKVTAKDGQTELALVDPTGKAMTPPTGTVFNIYWNTTGGVTKKSTKIANVASLSPASPYTHTGLTNGASYYYMITEVSPTGEESVESQQVSVIPQSAVAAVVVNAVFANTSTTTKKGQPGSPKNPNGYAGNQKVTVAWDVADFPTNYDYVRFTGTSTPAVQITSTNTIKGYYVYWSTDQIKTDKTNATRIPVPGTDLKFTHTALANGTRLYYAVTAVASPDPAHADFSALTAAQLSTLVSTQYESQILAQFSVVPEARVPAVPSNVAAAKGNQQVALSWKKDTSGTGVTNNIYWTTSTGVSKTTGTKISGITSNSYVHSGLESGTTYYYVITAVSDGESAESTVVSVTM
ncbi:MAG: fibronectin type [Geobacteraceae bacterium]|nr:MAG: fibronectin type [Geobacteraceae bacterium]